MKQHILYIKHKIQGKSGNKNHNALVFLRVFLIKMHQVSYLENNIRRVHLADIFNLISKQSQFMVILIASIPLILPIPYPPGIPTILGIPVTVFIINACLGKKFIKIPNKIMSRSMSMETLKQIIVKSKIAVRIIARVAKGGRMPFVTKQSLTKVHALFMLLMALLIIAPFPGTNYLPAFSIFIIALGMVLSDGILTIIGYTVGIIGIGIVSLFVIFGSKIIASFLNYAQYILYS